MRIGLVYTGIFATALMATWWLRQPDHRVIHDAAPPLALATATSASLAAAAMGNAAVPVVHAAATASPLPGTEDERDAIAGDVYPVVSVTAADAPTEPPPAQLPADMPVTPLAGVPPGEELPDQIAGDVYPTTGRL